MIAETATIRERALTALATRRLLEAEAEAERVRREQEREAQQFAKYLLDFQTELDRRGFAGVVATDRAIVVEDVPLALRYWREGTGLVALAPCAECGLGDEYTHVRNLADFGYVLAEWAPERADFRCQTCQDRAWYREQAERDRLEEETAGEEEIVAAALPPRCLEARLGDLLRELVRAEIQR